MMRFVEELRAGKAPSVRGTFGKTASRFQIGNLDLEDMAYQFYLKSASDQHAAFLEYVTELVEIGRLPVEEQLASVAKWDSAKGSQPLFTQLVAPSMSAHARFICLWQTVSRCAIAALAVERYRLSHGGWPDSLDALVPAYLPRVPIDPYNGAPLRFVRKTDRVVVYSVGPDGQDDGGNVAKNPYKPGRDIGFRLWDVNRRRQRPTPWSALRPLLWKSFAGSRP